MSTASVLTIVRAQLRDEGTQFSASVTGDGQTAIFDLPWEKIDPTTFKFYDTARTPSLLETPADYTLDAQRGMIFTAAAPPAGSLLTATGTSYRFFTDEQLTLYVQRAFALHTEARNPPVYLDAPATPSGAVPLPAVEEYLVALLALVEALWVLATDYSEDIDILTPEGVQIPREQRFSAIQQIIQARSEEYRELSARLNVGLDAISMFTLRRVSPITGRLVPVYIPREYDDLSATPQRISPPIDSGLT